MDEISVVEVIREGGWTYSKRLAWTVGREASKAWRKEYGRAPDYAMKPKTSGNFTNAPAHLKAVYPEAWRVRIEEIVRKYNKIAQNDNAESPGPRVQRATIEQAVGLAAWAREALTGQEQKLVWCVDLRKDVGEPDANGDIDGYHDKRWTETLERLRRTILAMEDNVNTTTEFGMIVVCMVGRDEGETPRPVAVELSIPHMVDIGKLMSKQPPVGRWRLMGDGEFRKASQDRSTPANYFIDGLPF